MTTFKYNYAKANFYNISSYINGIDWPAVFSDGNLNDSYNLFIETVNVAIDMFTPKVMSVLQSVLNLFGSITKSLI